MPKKKRTAIRDRGDAARTSSNNSASRRRRADVRGARGATAVPIISLKDFRSKVELVLDAREDALKVKKGAIKAYLYTKCLPRVLANLVDDEDDD